VEQFCSDYRCATNYLVGADEIWQAVSQSGPQRFANMKEMVMGKVIEFYVPAISHKPLKGASEQQCAKVIEFCTQTPVDSFACDEVHGNWTSAQGVACPSRDPQTAPRNLEATGTAFRGRATDSEGFGRPSRLSRSWIGKEYSVRHRQASSKVVMQPGLLAAPPRERDGQTGEGRTRSFTPSFPTIHYCRSTMSVTGSGQPQTRWPTPV
jgi:hypothetical protein